MNLRISDPPNRYGEVKESKTRRKPFLSIRSWSFEIAMPMLERS
jgi:hypothetical protein